MSTDTAASSKARTRCAWTREERAEWLRLLEESGKPLSEFCRENGLPESTVSLWRKQQRDPAAVEFIEVALPACATRSTSVVTIRVGADLAIEMPVGTDPTWLAEVVLRLRTET